jgi:hypothetical protein
MLEVVERPDGLLSVAAWAVKACRAPLGPGVVDVPELSVGTRLTIPRPGDYALTAQVVSCTPRTLTLRWGDPIRLPASDRPLDVLRLRPRARLYHEVAAFGQVGPSGHLVHDVAGFLLCYPVAQRPWSPGHDHRTPARTKQRADRIVAFRRKYAGRPWSDPEVFAALADLA